VKLIFAVLYVPLNDNSPALHVVIKQQFFTFMYICRFSISIHGRDRPTTTSSFRKHYKRALYGNSTSRFDFDLFVVIRCDSVPTYQNLSELNDQRQRHDVMGMQMFKMAAMRRHTIENLLPLSGFMTFCIWEGKGLLHTKARPSTSAS